MSNRQKSSDPSLSVTRRASLLTALGAAMTLTGCGGGGSGGMAAGAGAAAGISGAAARAGAAAEAGAGEAPAAPGPVALAVANNQIAVLGDSRSANATQDANIPATNRIAAESYMGYAMIASNFRGDFTGAYAINANKLQDMLDRLGPTPQTRGQMLSVEPGLSAGIVIFLGGVNNSVDPINVTGPLYQSILEKLANAGKTVIVCNELPDNTAGMSSTEQVNRRTFLDSVTLANNNGRLIRVNTFDSLLQPGTANTSKTGTFAPGDSLHPGPSGNQILGQIIGAELERILAAGGYPSRSAKVPRLASESVLPYAMLAGTGGIIATELAGAGGTNRNGAGAAGVTGTVADGWTFARDPSLAALLNASQPVAGSSLTITLSKGLDSENFATQSIRVLGQAGPVGAIYNLYFTNVAYFTAANLVSGSANGIALADGDRLYSAARLKVSAAAKGLLGPGIEVVANSPSAPSTGQANLSGTVPVSSSPRDWRSTAAFDKLVLSQPRVLPPGYATTLETKLLQQELLISIAGGVPVDFTIEISRFGMIKNP